ncbi:MAG: hypothetical protein QOJ56_5551 [Mycobacterium sp.]|jgi:hypothetical protein|nr:hypothetical protein [Mycobacterium sp.]
MSTYHTYRLGHPGREKPVADYPRPWCARRADLNRRGRGYCLTAGAREHRSWNYDSCGFS